MFELDVEEIDGAIEPLETGEFLRDVEAVVLGDFHVAALEHDVGREYRFGLRIGFCRGLVQNLTGQYGVP
ncbi:hypothetical protein MSAS_48580 [Mycobacterium saskatchewanense]|nr:hypothetical protein MSAS_48580 [Mycobacterium saskatchewanense]